MPEAETDPASFPLASIAAGDKDKVGLVTVRLSFLDESPSPREPGNCGHSECFSRDSMARLNEDRGEV